MSRTSRSTPCRFVALAAVQLCALTGITLFAVSCDRPPDRGMSAAVNAVATTTDLTGAGATFPYPLYARWFNEYAALSNVRINYQPIGSGGGIRQLLSHTVDFGASDVPMSDEELASAPPGSIAHIPTVLGAVAVTYNLPALTTPLRLSGAAIAEIFLGTLTRWNDPRLQALNPGARLPDRDILVVHRADGSGTSYILSDYLTTLDATWAAGPGRGKDVRWPVGIGGKGNEGVAALVKQLDGAVGYLEVVYARQNELPVAEVQNHAGHFTSPEAAAITSAATSITDSLPASSDLRVSLVNAPAVDAYPIVSFTWLLLAPESIGPAKTQHIATFLRWSLTEGGVTAAELGYVPLPASVAQRVLTGLSARVARTLP
jgi:phosphate transport system substrate-binding protein